MDWLIPSIAFLIFFNILSLAFFVIDKMNAMRRGWRVRESTLLTLAFFGPFGAYAGMRLLRHKTRKLKFVLVKVFMGLQIALAALCLYYFQS